MSQTTYRVLGIIVAVLVFVTLIGGLLTGNRLLWRFIDAILAAGI